jgi:hypothetical protein
MKIIDFPTAATYNIGHTNLVLKIGNISAGVYREWFGRKCPSAKRETLNLSLECVGPKEWVLKQWNDKYTKW